MNIEPYRFLIVDDEPDHRLIVRILLSKLWNLDLAITEAANGQEAVRLSQQWHPDWILMDLNMAEMDGYEATRQIRNLEQERDTMNLIQPLQPPAWIIAVSGFTFKRDRDSAFASGCDDFIAKPYEINELFNKLLKAHFINQPDLRPHQGGVAAAAF
jgi:CheY-like chemotaxis protein